jgi:predicted secreted Zn-dependent protease
MLSLFLTLAASAQTATATPPAVTAPVTTAPASRSLASLPGINIKYYDVAGKNMKAVIKSIDKQRKDPATGQARTVAHNWSIDAGFRKRTVNGVCTITAVEAPFIATVELPRHSNPAQLTPADAAEWQRFTTKIETEAAAKLWFAYDRSLQLEATIKGKDCDKGIADGTAFINQLKADAAAFQPTVATPAPAAAATK